MNRNYHTDVLIVGGGPAGSAAALGILRYSSLQVTIVEQSALTGIRVGEQVNKSLFDLLDYLGIDAEAQESFTSIGGYGTTAAWGSERLQSRASIFTAEGESLQLDREQFDLHLLREASDRGATILPRTRCTTIQQDDQGNWHVELQHQQLGAIQVRARFLVDASGRGSSISRQLGLPVNKLDQLVGIGAFLHFPDRRVTEQNTLIETVEAGWWYCATLPDQVQTLTLFTDAALASENGFTKPQQWNALLQGTEHMRKRVSGAVSQGELWTRNAFSHCTDASGREGFLAVGDAACSFDPISAMGIGFAISSACHAARAICHYFSGDVAALRSYHASIPAIYRDYLETRSRYYRKEQRWAQSPFWKARLQSVPVS